MGWGEAPESVNGVAVETSVEKYGRHSQVVILIAWPTENIEEMVFGKHYLIFSEKKPTEVHELLIRI